MDRRLPTRLVLNELHNIDWSIRLTGLVLSLIGLGGMLLYDYYKQKDLKRLNS